MAGYVYRGNRPHVPLVYRLGEHTDGLKPCGTHAAYKRHRSRGEPVCEDCADAAAEYELARIELRRAKKAANQ